MQVVFFYTPGCPHCEAAKPHFRMAASGAGVPFALCDIKQHKRVGRQERIESIPTIRKFAGGRAVDTYEGDRTPHSILQWASSPAPGADGAAGGRGAGAGRQTAQVEAYDRACQEQFGPNAKFDGTDSCECKVPRPARPSARPPVGRPARPRGAPRADASAAPPPLPHFLVLTGQVSSLPSY